MTMMMVFSLPPAYQTRRGASQVNLVEVNYFLGIYFHHAMGYTKLIMSSVFQGDIFWITTDQ